MSTRTFYQSHECEGFRAKVTIEWSMPTDVDPDHLPAWRAQTAEDIADSVLAFSGRRMRQMVQAMRGHTISSRCRYPACDLINCAGCSGPNSPAIREGK